jgi:predicted RNA-binding protein with RPS1 domain
MNDFLKKIEEQRKKLDELEREMENTKTFDPMHDALKKWIGDSRKDLDRMETMERARIS